MVSAREFVYGAVIFQVCLLMIPLVSGLIKESSFNRWPGGRICDNRHFGDPIRLSFCQDIMPRNMYARNADASCENINMKMLNSSDQEETYTPVLLVCRNGRGGRIVGCICAGGSRGTSTLTLKWNGIACY